MPASKFSLQSPPQLIPAGLEVTVPVPLPSLVTERANCSNAKVAVTEAAALIVT